MYRWRTMAESQKSDIWPSDIGRMVPPSFTSLAMAERQEAKKNTTAIHRGQYLTTVGCQSSNDHANFNNRTNNLYNLILMGYVCCGNSTIYVVANYLCMVLECIMYYIHCFLVFTIAVIRYPLCHYSILEVRTHRYPRLTSKKKPSLLRSDFMRKVIPGAWHGIIRQVISLTKPINNDE